MRSTQLLALFLPVIFMTGALGAGDDVDVRTERVQKEKEIAGLPSLPATSLHEAVIIRMENNKLSLYTRLPPTGTMSKITIKELPGICTADVRLIGVMVPPKPSTPYRPVMFDLVHWVFNETSATVSSTSVSTTPMNLQIARYSENATEATQVSLIQSGDGANPDEPAVHFIINTGGRSIVHTARDFTSLRRQFPGDTAEYLEPIFREIGADEIVFSPDSALAWQVFAVEARPDPAVDEKVQSILPRLDSDDFHERESASGEFKKLGEPAAVSLWKIDRTHLSPEQNSRIDAFLKQYQPATEADVTRLRNDVTFLLECLYDPDEFLCNTALNRLQKIAGHPILFDRTLRGDARRAAINNLRQRLLPPSSQPVEPG